jgi:beta-phosphoglucomutase
VIPFNTLPDNLLFYKSWKGDFRTVAALRGVIWDMDGVLVDTGEFHFQSWMDTLPNYEVSFSREIFNNTFGMNNEGILKLLMGEDFNPQVITEISERKEGNFRRAIRGKVKTLPGVLSLLNSIKGANIPQAIGSSGPQENIDAIVMELGLNSYFQALISAAQMPSKPNPTVFSTAAQSIRAPAAHCVVIEDAIAGVEAAHRAKMKCVAVTTTNPAEALKQADVIVDSLDEITVDKLIALLDESTNI